MQIVPQEDERRIQHGRNRDSPLPFSRRQHRQPLPTHSQRRSFDREFPLSLFDEKDEDDEAETGVGSRARGVGAVR